MSLNATPSGERIHIGFFGRRNAGKSSLVNKVTGQDLAVVSPTKGTTTDPVQKAMELLPLGPVVIIDTPGSDDEGELGELRIEKTMQTVRKTDIAVLVLDATTLPEELSFDVLFSPEDRELLEIFKEHHTPVLIAFSKCDDQGKLQSLSTVITNLLADSGLPCVFTSAQFGTGIEELKNQLALMQPQRLKERHLIGHILSPGDVVVLVVPIDESAPKGRLILPQQQTIRDILEAGAIAVVTKETELETALSRLADKPRLVITDSQVFDIVYDTLPKDIPLTSFSILMAGYKGFLDTALEAVSAVQDLQDGDKVLIAEGCTHHRQCNDIGTVKIPRWLKAHTNEQFEIHTVSGREFPENLSDYRLVIHCGACMLNEKEIAWRVQTAAQQNIPFINYGVLIAHMNGILDKVYLPE